MAAIMGDAGIDNKGFQDIALHDTTIYSGKEKDGKAHAAVVSFHDITYTVATREKRKTVTKTVLNKVSGIFKPGMNAILGPTGGGKTSLLDVLAARKSPQGLSGRVLIDGKDQPRNFRLISGYVVQDDVIMGTLTVRENLEFSASLRLPETISRKEKKKRVDDIIEELGLTSCANTKIGTQFFRGVSGGERKRTSIGMELVIQPGILFLDEPTTGLDATTASSVIEHLARLSRQGRTIIFSIHQPRFSIFRFFDRLHLLSLGETVYHGSAQTALEYFRQVGYECEEHNNPADFFLDTIIANAASLKGGEESMHSEIGNAENGMLPRTSELLTEVFKNSEVGKQLDKEGRGILGSSPEKGSIKEQEITYATSFIQQLMVVSKRAAKNIIRNPFVLIIQNVMLLVFAVLTGLIYFQLDTTRPAGIQNRVGAFLFLSMQQVFVNMSGMEIFIQERAIFVHESANGFYRVSPYYFGKIVCDLLPLRLCPCLLFSTVVYWMMGFQAEADNFFIFVLTLVLTSFAATGVAFAMSSSTSQLSVATLLSALTFILSMIFGGIFVNIESLPGWIRWIQYLSMFRYTINALSIVEMSGLEFCDENGNMCITGEMYLKDQGIKDTTWGLWQNHVALSCFIMGFFFLAYVQLRRIPKSK